MKALLPFALLAFVTLTGCEAVYTPQPIGDEPMKLEVAEWQATWLEGDVVLMTTVLDAENGMLQTAWLERGENGAKMEVLTGQVRRSGEMLFLNVLDEPDEADAAGGADSEAGAAENAPQPTAASEPRYYWARARLDGARLAVWWPNVETFRAAIRDGRLPGTIDKDDNIVLGNLSPEQLALITAPESGLLDWQEPIVFVRVGD